MGLSPGILKAVLRRGYKVPTPIQRKTIPLLLAGQDVLGMARTGSGKTAAFLIPLLEKLKEHSSTVGLRSLILSPTRELAIQTLKFAKQLGTFTNLRFCLILGGDAIDEQFKELATNPDVAIATPGRFLHHLVELNLTLRYVEYIVFDEADRLFEMGFAEQLQEILKRVNNNNSTNIQKVLFSATLPQTVLDFSNVGLIEPKIIRLDTDIKISENLQIHFFAVRPEEKIPALLYLLKHIIPLNNSTIVFAATKHHVEFLNSLLTLEGFQCSLIYGSMDPTSRKINLAKFRLKKTSLLIVTDVAARGIDIPLLDNVVNFDFPPRPKLFVHRVGRAARAGRKGTAYSLVTPTEFPFMVDLHLFLGRPLRNRVESSGSGSNNSNNTILLDPQEAYFGKLPLSLFETEFQHLKTLLDKNSELAYLLKISEDAYQPYLKSRPAASGESVKRSKEMLDTVDVHPLIADRLESKEKARTNFIEELKNFRPPSTIFEVEALTNFKNKSMTSSDVMKKKRATHEDLITKHKKQSLNKKMGVDFMPENLNEYHQKKEAESKLQEQKETQPQKSSRDNNYFINYFSKDNQATEKGYQLERSQNASDLVVELLPDEGSAKKAKDTTQRWDRKRKKFVTGVDPSLSISKRQKTRTGKILTGTYKPKLYQEWKKKTHLSVPLEGGAETTTTNVKQFPVIKRYLHSSTTPTKQEKAKKHQAFIEHRSRQKKQKISQENKEKQKKMQQRKGSNQKARQGGKAALLSSHKKKSTGKSKPSKFGKHGKSGKSGKHKKK